MRLIAAGVGGAIIIALVGAVLLMNMNQRQPVQSMDKKTYVALGDSVAAGLGAGEYADASACNRTKDAYPAKVAERSGYNATSFACSGATIPQGIQGSQEVNERALDPQLDALFALRRTPDVITITIGANDINWTRFINCYQGECGSDAERQEFSRTLRQFKSNLNETLSNIKSHYGTKPPVVILTGYYQVLPKGVPSKCEELAGFSQSELDWIQYVFKSLNDTIEQSASASSFVSFAPVDFDGHELCGSDPWVQGLRDTAPYHPNSKGQSAIADAVMTTIKKRN